MSVERPYERHVFVCTTGPWCLGSGGKDVHKAMKSGVKEAGLQDECRVNQSGCLNQCGHGPMAVVYPEGVWYGALDVEKAKRIVAGHIVGREPVSDLLYRPERVGNNKTPEIREAEARKKESGPKA